MITGKRNKVLAGCVLCVEIEGLYKRYFQFIGRDLYQLNTDVIRVFKTWYPLKDEPLIEDIVKDEVDFYSHTSAYIGVKQGLWFIVGRSSNIGKLENVGFYVSCAPPMGVDNIKSSHWEVWTLGHKRHYVGKLSPEYLQKYHYGYAFAPIHVLYRIKHGKYEGILPIPE